MSRSGSSCSVLRGIALVTDGSDATELAVIRKDGFW
jgi:hypothetical protein